MIEGGNYRGDPDQKNSHFLLHKIKYTLFIKFRNTLYHRFDWINAIKT